MNDFGVKTPKDPAKILDNFTPGYETCAACVAPTGAIPSRLEKLMTGNARAHLDLNRSQIRKPTCLIF